MRIVDTGSLPRPTFVPNEYLWPTGHELRVLSLAINIDEAKVVCQ